MLGFGSQFICFQHISLCRQRRLTDLGDISWLAEIGERDAGPVVTGDADLDASCSDKNPVREA